jgi:hypothetical protein
MKLQIIKVFFSLKSILVYGLTGDRPKILYLMRKLPETERENKRKIRKNKMHM